MKKEVLLLLLFLTVYLPCPAVSAVHTVTNAGDSGAGSLRQAILDSNSDFEALRTIELEISVPVINLLSPLSSITRPVAFRVNNGTLPVTLSLTTSLETARTMRVQTDVGVSLPDKLLSVKVQSSSTSSSALYSASNLLVTGDFGSNLANRSTGVTAYGIYAGKSLAIDGAMKAGASVSAEAPHGAYGLYSVGNITLSGPFSALVTANATTDGTVYGFRSGLSVADVMTLAGGIGTLGSIQATALNGDSNSASTVYGLFSGGDIVIGQTGGITGISGMITAKAAKSTARGIHAASVTIYGGIPATGNITASAGMDTASAIEADASLAVIGSIAGKVSAAAVAGSSAYGIHAGGALSISGGITGSALLSAVAGSTDAYALYAQAGSISIGGGISGMVRAESGSYRAAGLYAKGGGIHGATDGDPLVIDGALSASAYGAAAAVMAEGPMNLLITGTLSGVDSKGSGCGYSLRSGSFGAYGSLVDGPASADRVTLAGNGTLQGHISLGAGNDTLFMQDACAVTGNVDMGAGDDTLTLRGLASIRGNIAGGDGGEISGDQLLLSGWHGAIAGATAGWEQIAVVNGSEVALVPAASFLLAPSIGQQLSLMIEAGSAMRAAGGSPLRVEIDGNLKNAGLLDLRNGSAGDRVRVTGSYTGSEGALGLDMALGGWTDSNPESLDLLVVGMEGTSSGSLSGTTRLRVRNISQNGVIRVTTGKGFPVLKVNGTSTPNALLIDDSDPLFSGAEVQLVLDGSVWYLQIAGGRDVLPLESPPPPASQHLIGGIGLMAGALGTESVPALSERQGGGGSSSWWSRTTGRRFISGSESGGISSRASGYSGTLQAGSDLAASGSGALRRHAGICLGTGFLQAESDASGVHSGRTDISLISIGGYAGVSAIGIWHIETELQASRYDIGASFSSSGSKERVALWGLSASVEGCRLIGIGETFLLEPQAQLTVQRIIGYDIETPDGSARQHPLTGVLGRMKMRGTVKPEGWMVTPFLELQAEQEFGEPSRVSYEESGWTYSVQTDRKKVGGALGISSRSAKPDALEYSLKAGVMAGVDGHGSRDYLLTLGLRKSW
ncbi:MAG: hypothetical protein WCH05_02000 [Chlorobiaceae bacterium]